MNINTIITNTLAVLLAVAIVLFLTSAARTMCGFSSKESSCDDVLAAIAIGILGIATIVLSSAFIHYLWRITS